MLKLHDRIFIRLKKNTGTYRTDGQTLSDNPYGMTDRPHVAITAVGNASNAEALKKHAFGRLGDISVP